MPSNRKVKGQARRTARLLFGLPEGRVMESPEERQATALVLSHSTDARVQRLVTDLLSSDPDSTRTSLAVIMERHGLNFHMISEEYTRLKKAEGFIRTARHLPAIMEQTAQNAQDRWEDCARCSGTGKRDTPDGVIDCGCVDGKVFIRADETSLKLMFDTFGLTGKSSGVNVNLDLRHTDKPESLGDLAASLGPIIEGGVK